LTFGSRNQRKPVSASTRNSGVIGQRAMAPEVMRITTPILYLIGEADFELRRINGGRAFYALWERGVPVEYQVYPMARRAFDFRADQTPEEKIATRHARQRAEAWLKTWMKVGQAGACR